MSTFCFIIAKYWDYTGDSFITSAFKELEYCSQEIYVLDSEEEGIGLF